MFLITHSLIKSHPLHHPYQHQTNLVTQRKVTVLQQHITSQKMMQGTYCKISKVIQQLHPFYYQTHQSYIQIKLGNYQTLRMNQLTAAGKKTAIFKNLHSSLISLSQLCDGDCNITLNKKTMKVYKNNTLIMQGNRSTRSIWCTINEKTKKHNNTINHQ